jgi:putative cardiolipin synthase
MHVVRRRNVTEAAACFPRDFPLWTDEINSVMRRCSESTVKLRTGRWQGGVSRGCFALLVFAGVGCGTLPDLHDRISSQAVAPVRNASLGAAPDLSRPQGLSGVATLQDGPESFAARVALARFSRQSLDMQYYIWDGDLSGTYLMSEVLDAADRGVRVRLLLDDHPSGGLVEGVLQQLASAARAFGAELEDGFAKVTPQTMQSHHRIRALMDEVNSGGRDLVGAALDTHPNIEVRMFNPNKSRHGFARMVHLVADFGRLNRRMHNKIFAADNQLAVVGGRNIGDKYYGLHPEHNWRDLDMLVRGPVVRDISTSFDDFWNSEWAVPVAAFTWKTRSDRRLSDLRHELDAFFEAEKDARLRELDDDTIVADRLRKASSRMVHAPARVVADRPVKFHRNGEAVVADALAALADGSHHEILVESAYFVPEKRTFSRMEQRVAEGVTVCTLTNSLASTNHLTVHAGYIRHRKDLLRSGVRMHELKPAKGEARRFGFLVRDSRAGIHTKAVVFDRERVFVGTFNLDPRSAELNTEIGIVVDSPVVSRQVADFIREGMSPDLSWHVQLGRPGHVHTGDRRMCWCSGDPAMPHIVSHEPDTDFLTRILLHIVSRLPIQKQL